MAEFVVGTLREVAEFAGVALATVKTEWVPGGMPGVPGRGKRKGRYDLAAIFKWYRGRVAQSGELAGDQVSVAMRKARLAEQLAKARERKVAADRAENLAIDRTEHELALLALADVFRGALQGGSTKIRDRAARAAYRKAVDLALARVAAEIKARSRE